MALLALRSTVGRLLLIPPRDHQTRQFLQGAPGRTRTCDLPLRRRQLYPLSYGGPSGRLPPSEPAQAQMPIRRQCSVCQLFGPGRVALLAAGLHRKARSEVARVGAEAAQARDGNEQEQTEEHQGEHGKNYAVAKILPRVAETPSSIEILPISGHAEGHGS